MYVCISIVHNTTHVTIIRSENIVHIENQDMILHDFLVSISHQVWYHDYSRFTIGNNFKMFR